MQSHNQNGGDQHFGVWPNDIDSSSRSSTLTPEFQAPYGILEGSDGPEHEFYHYGGSSEENAHPYAHNYAGTSSYYNGDYHQENAQVTPETIPYPNGHPIRGHDQVDQVFTHYTPESLSHEINRVNTGITPFQRAVSSQTTPADDLTTVQSFKDFFDGTIYPIYIQGNAFALRSLSAAVRAGAQIQHRDQEDMYYAYGPLETAISGACHRLSITTPSAEELCRIHRSSDFKKRAETYAAERHLSQEMFNNMMNPDIVNEDVMAILLESFMAKQTHPLDCRLGFVVLNRNEYPHAFLYPLTTKNAVTVAWVVCDNRQGFQFFTGISPDPHVAPPQFINQTLDTPAVDATPRSAPHHPLKRRRPPTDQGTPTKPPKISRDTSVAVRASQTPYPSTYTAKQIYDHHASNLHYNNILKVALVYSNADIIKKVQALPNNTQRLNSQSAVAKRIGTGCDWLADKFSIPRKVLRCAYDTARRESRINARPKKQCSEEETEAWKEACEAAIGWVEEGGPLARDVAARFGVEMEPEDAGATNSLPVSRASPPHDSPLGWLGGDGAYPEFAPGPVAFPGFGAPPPAPPFAPSANRALTPGVPEEEPDLGGHLLGWDPAIDPELYTFGWE